MLDYLNRQEKIMTSLKEGLTTKGYSFKVLSGLNARLDVIKDIKQKYSMEVLSNTIDNTNYPILLQITHGLDNVYKINKKKNEWFLYAIDKTNIVAEDIKIMQESFLSNKTLIYIAEKSIAGAFVDFYVIFSRIKYSKSHEYVNHRWQ